MNLNDMEEEMRLSNGKDFEFPPGTQCDYLIGLHGRREQRQMEHLQSLEKRLDEMQRILAGFIKEAIVESPAGTQCKGSIFGDTEQISKAIKDKKEVRFVELALYKSLDNRLETVFPKDQYKH